MFSQVTLPIPVNLPVLSAPVNAWKAGKALHDLNPKLFLLESLPQPLMPSKPSWHMTMYLGHNRLYFIRSKANQTLGSDWTIVFCTSLCWRAKSCKGSAPRYLGPLVQVADQPGRRTLHFASSSSLLIPPVRLSTVGSRVFSLAGPRVWTTLPEETTSAPSLTIFCRHLKNWIFRQSYSDLIIWSDTPLTIY